jgi:hypothetical protein
MAEAGPQKESMITVWPEAGVGGPGPSGKPFVEDKERLARRYPNLWRRFGAGPLG